MSGWIKKGMPVCSITNLSIIMTVEEFKYKTGTVIDDNNKTIVKKCLIGIMCTRTAEGGERISAPFHSKELVPAEIAEKGSSEAMRFYLREGKYKEI